MEDTLYISHNIFLSKKQRYSLFDGKKIKVIGVSLQSWFPERNKQMGIECFSLYKLIPKRINDSRIKEFNNGYNIYIKNDNIQSIFGLFQKKEKKLNLPDAKNLLDVIDGGKEWMFISYDINKTNYKIKHTIEIKKIETFLESLN